MSKCCICGKELEKRYEHNAAPVMDGKCCAVCNCQIVLPARLKNLYSNNKKEEKKW